MTLSRRLPDREPPEGTRNTQEHGKLVVMPGAARAAPNEVQILSSESLILAQNERWQRGLGMQVERDPEGSNVGR